MKINTMKERKDTPDVGDLIETQYGMRMIVFNSGSKGARYSLVNLETGSSTTIGETIEKLLAHTTVIRIIKNVNLELNEI